MQWPFIRFMGMQEPASSIFSILNGAVAVYMLLQFRKRVPSTAPMYEAWHGYFAVSSCWYFSLSLDLLEASCQVILAYMADIRNQITGMVCVTFLLTAQIATNQQVLNSLSFTRSLIHLCNGFDYSQPLAFPFN